MAYWNAAGLAATRAVEGGAGGYTARDPSSSASGAYSFLDSTWRSYAPKAGVDITQYPRAYLAPPAAQDAVAAITPVSNWGGTWAGSGGANAQNPAYIQATPMNVSGATTSISGLPFSDTPISDPNSVPGPSSGILNPPVSGTQAPTGTFMHPGQGISIPGVAGTNPSFGDGTGGVAGGGSAPDSSFTYNPPSGSGTGSGTGAQAQPGGGTPVQVNLGPQTTTDLQSWVNAPINAAEKWASAQFAQLQNWFGRGFLILIGIVVVGIALWKATGGPSAAEIVTAVK